MEAPDSDPSHSDPDPVVDPGPGSARTAGGTTGGAASSDPAGIPGPDPGRADRKAQAPALALAPPRPRR